jgi:hypothetical protein
MISDEFINTPYPSLLDDSLITETSLGPGEPFAGKMVSRCAPLPPLSAIRRAIAVERSADDSIPYTPLPGTSSSSARSSPTSSAGCIVSVPATNVTSRACQSKLGSTTCASLSAGLSCLGEYVLTPGPSPRRLEKLKDWLASVPGAESSFTSAEMWAVMFHNSVLLLFRPSPACPRPTRAALSACLRSSSYLIRIVRRMYQANKMNYLWLGAHTLFMAGITYLYSLWNVALGNIDDPPSLTESMMDIQSCSSVLQALSCACPLGSAGPVAPPPPTQRPVC